MKKKIILLILGLLYAAGLLALLFGRAPHALSGGYWETLPDFVNLIPFRTVTRQLLYLSRHPAAKAMWTVAANLLGNVLLFVPLGILLPAAWEKLRRGPAFFLAAVLLLLTVETVQLFTLLGYFDVDDLILNLAGASAGFLIFRLWTRGKDKKRQKE